MYIHLLDKILLKLEEILYYIKFETMEIGLYPDFVK